MHFSIKIQIFVAAIFCSILPTNAQTSGQVYSLKRPVKEGFNTTSLAENFKNAWENTLLLEVLTNNEDGSIKHAGLGTTSIVFKLTEGTTTYLGLVTARHVVGIVKDPTIRIFQNVKISEDERLRASNEGIPLVEKALPVKTISITESKQADLAFIVV